MTVLDLPAGRSVEAGGVVRVALGVLAGLAATAGLLAVISAGFALSFDAIGAVAVAAHVRPDWAWLLPAAVDGAMAVGTVATVVMRRLGQRAIYPWGVVLINATISIFCNALHAYMGESLTLPPGIAMAVSAIPAINLALSVHLLVLLVDAVATLLTVRDSDDSHTNDHKTEDGSDGSQTRTDKAQRDGVEQPRTVDPPVPLEEGRRGRELRQEAWRWAVAHRQRYGTLPSGRVLAERYQRRERWGRLVKTAGLAGEFDESAMNTIG